MQITNIVNENGEFQKIARNIKITQTDKKSLQANTCWGNLFNQKVKSIFYMIITPEDRANSSHTSDDLAGKLSTGHVHPISSNSLKEQRKQGPMPSTSLKPESNKDSTKRLMRQAHLYNHRFSAGYTLLHSTLKINYPAALCPFMDHSLVMAKGLA